MSDRTEISSEAKRVDPAHVLDDEKSGLPQSGNSPSSIHVTPRGGLQAQASKAEDTPVPRPPILPDHANLEASETVCSPSTAKQGAGEQPISQVTRPVPQAEILDGEELAANDEVGSYIIRDMIGRGGCGTVYAAEHRSTGEVVAVKVLRLSLAGSPHQVRRFVQEARALQLVEHPGIVEVYDTGYLHDGRPYFVMELLNGRGLASLLGERGRFSPAEALEVLTPVCEMLELAHRAGIVHRDIKASNIMITEEASQRQVKLLDFGLAKLLNPEQSGSMQTSMGVVLGTLHSMAPEQIMGATVDGRTDIYALGALLHRLLTGRHPFEDVDGHKVARMHLHKPPPLPSQLAPVSPAVDAVVRRALEKDPNRRFQTAGDFLAALRDSVETRSTAIQSEGEAIAIYVEGRATADESAFDDALFDRLMQLLDTAERELTRAGFQILLQTTNGILAARLLPGSGADPTRGLVADAMQFATDLHGSLVELAQSEPSGDARDDHSIHVNVCLHRDEVTLKRQGQKTAIAGGRVADLSSWAPRHDLQGACITRRSASNPATCSYVVLSAS